MLGAATPAKTRVGLVPPKRRPICPTTSALAVRGLATLLTSWIKRLSFPAPPQVVGLVEELCSATSLAPFLRRTLPSPPPRRLWPLHHAAAEFAALLAQVCSAPAGCQRRLRGAPRPAAWLRF